MACGYDGHVCDIWRGTVQFISRYRGENDYCVGGTRVSVSDDGTTSGTPEQIEKVRLFELDRYADYLRWHCENKQRLGLDDSLFPFTVHFPQTKG